MKKFAVENDSRVGAQAEIREELRRFGSEDVEKDLAAVEAFLARLPREVYVFEDGQL